MNVATRVVSGEPQPSGPEAEICHFRRFGARGPVYEIIAVGEKRTDGDWEMRIRLPESGEEADYQLSHILRDPLEA